MSHDNLERVRNLVAALVDEEDRKRCLMTSQEILKLVTAAGPQIGSLAVALAAAVVTETLIVLTPCEPSNPKS